MKYIKHFLFSAFLFSIPHCKAVILDQSLIEKKALEIEKKLTHDRYMMYGLTTFAITYGIYQWMPLLITMATKKPVPAEPENKLPTEKTEKPVDNRSISETLKDGIWSFGSGTRDLFHDLFFTKQSWMSMLQFWISVSGANIIALISEEFIHPDTLRWYIHAHAPYHLTIIQMKEKIKDGAVDGDILSLLHGCLVRQALLMCAYITYKVKHLDAAEKIIGERAKISMLTMQEKWLSDIEQQLQLQDADRNYALIESMLDSYSLQIAKQIDHFALIEGETRRERLAIKKKR